MKRGTPLLRKTPLKARTPLKASTSKPRKAPRSPKTAPGATFASLAREYDLPAWIKSRKHLRWSSPVEKGIAWEIVKKLVRLTERDCYTCHRQNLIEAGLKADSGHCYPVGQVGSNNALSWDLRLIHLQCSFCNGVGQGEQGAYEERIKREYGEAFLLESRARRYRQDPIKDWKGKLAELWELYQTRKSARSVPGAPEGSNQSHLSH